MILQTIRVEDAVGKVLSHDITKIVKGEFKGAYFKKGRVINKQDIPELLKLGKENIYVLEIEKGEVHEDEAGVRLGIAVAGENTRWDGPKESRVNIYACCDGLLKINVPSLEAVNGLPDVILSTLLNNTVVKKGDILAGTKVIPLLVPEHTLAEAERICREAGWLIKVKPFKPHRVGVVITGNEVCKKRIRDGFGPIIKEKVAAFGSAVTRVEYVPDDRDGIKNKICAMAAGGVEIIFVTGGMSVDPDDVTPKAIRLTGAIVEKYGAPALPGAMFMLAYLGDAPVLGIPACGMFFKTTIVDLLLPRLLAGEKITGKDIVSLAHGGLCRSCDTCRFPNCTFGKGAN